MIIRVMDVGQWEVPQSEVRCLQGIDADIARALQARDGMRLREIVNELIEVVQLVGTPIPSDVFRVSDVVLPNSTTPIPEIVQWFRDAASDVQGLIPDHSEHFLSET